MSEADSIRRDFAAGWAKVGETWGIAPSTAAVQGYLLLHGGPISEAELRSALGLSHRAAFGALAECERWGLAEQLGTRRTGRRGPAGRAWVAVGDHWEWLRRVAGSRKERETDPVLPLLEACRRRAETAGDEALQRRIDSLVGFARQFDRGIGAVVGSDASTIAHLFGVLSRLDDATVARLLAALAAVPEDDLARAATHMATMRAPVLRRLLRVAAQPGVARMLARIG